MIEDADTNKGRVVESGDSSAMIDEWHSDGEEMFLAIPAYRTVKGTDVNARHWRLVWSQDGPCDPIADPDHIARLPS